MLFLGLFLLFVFVRLAAFNKTLVTEIYFAVKSKKVSIALLSSFALAAIANIFLYFYNVDTNLQRLREKAQTIAITASLQIEASDMLKLKSKDDYSKPEWRKIVNILKMIRENNKAVIYVYILRYAYGDSEGMEFVADSHSLDPFANTDSNANNDIDANADGKIEPEGADLLQWPGQKYNAPRDAYLAFQGPRSTVSFYEDQWGKVITGYAPIRNQDGISEAIVAVDIAVDQFYKMNLNTFLPMLIWTIILLLLLLFRSLALSVLKNRKI